MSNSVTDDVHMSAIRAVYPFNQFWSQSDMTGSCSDVILTENSTIVPTDGLMYALELTGHSGTRIPNWDGMLTFKVQQ